jgi:hypothetical protein
MCRYKTIACILLILSVFSSVLAAPVAVREVREARTDAVDGEDNVIIGLVKRVGEEDPLFARAQDEPSSSSSSGDGQPGPSTKIQPASSSKAKKVSWSPLKEVTDPSGKTLTLPFLLPPPGRDGYLAKMAAQHPPSPKIEHASPLPKIKPASPPSHFDLPSPPGREKYLANTAAQQSPSRSPLKSFVDDSKNVLGKFGKLKYLLRP